MAIQALSNAALHVPVTYDETNIYGDKDKIRKKVKDALKFFENLADGSLLLGGSFEPSLDFECLVCGITIKKFVDNLTMPAVVSCTNPSCIESYVIEHDDKKEIKVTSRRYQLSCQGCGFSFEIPHRMLDKLTHNQMIQASCNKCGFRNEIIMVPRQKTIKTPS
ncbi:hypothetical protein KW533_20615 [Vibrio fluvialis]|nr:hypothetical protein [Vibrio fluvialis]